jgi:hypothetical protein
VVQEMIKRAEEWKLIMREDLAQDILDDSATATPTPTPTPEPTTPEPTTTPPEEESPSSEDLFDCEDFGRPLRPRRRSWTGRW